MANKLNIAVIGATGNVGRQTLEILHERDFPIGKLDVYASKKSVGRKVSFGEKELTIDDLDRADFSETDIVFNTAGSKVAQQYRQQITKAGALLIDKSSLYRMDDDVPLIIPEINGSLISKLPESMVVANPNCVAIPIASVLKLLNDHIKITDVSAATYQSVSGAGKKGMDELYDETKAKFMHQSLDNKVFAKDIAFNIIPQIGELEESGYTSEETKIIEETKKILNQQFNFSVTSVRVPVFIGHSIALSITFEKEFLAKDAIRILEKNDFLYVKTGSDIQTPLDVVGEDDIIVSRIRNNITSKKTIDMWIIVDNLRKGAALNGVQIAEKLQNKL